MKLHVPLIVGVDPGLDGGVAALYHDGRVCQCRAMPTVKVGRKREIDHGAMKLLFLGVKISRVYLEKVHAMPGQGVTSMFGFGQTYGATRQAIVSAGYEYDLVRPQDWKRYHGLIGKPKDAVLEYVAAIWPDTELPGNKAQRKGVADALCIAEYARRELKQ